MSTYRNKYFEITKKNPEIFTKEVVFSLFCDNFGCDKTSMLLHLDEEIKDEETLNKYIEEILVGKPYQYTLGYTYFLGNKFIVNESVLIPRQESEQLVLDTFNLIKQNFNHEIDMLDMCTGSGCLGISLKKWLPANVDLVDISEDALKVAENNANLNKTKVGILKSDLFKDLPQKKYNVIVCNPPYIRDKSTVSSSTLKYEPHLALFATPVTRFYEEVFKAKEFRKDHFILAFEIGEDMKDELEVLVKEYFKDAKYIFKKDIYEKDRFLYIIQ